MNPETLRLPEALLQELAGVPGADPAALMAAHAIPAPVSVRLNPAKPSSQFATQAPVPWCPTGRYLPERPVFSLDPLWHAGVYYVQEASSMLLHWVVETLLPERDGLRVLDLCAAPGGKSTLLASLLPDSALLICNEAIRGRVGILEENIARWGRSNTWVSGNDPAHFGSLPEFFDLMVVDAPCSGSGLFRKDPDALQHWSEDAVRHCAARQRRILTDALPALKPGGLLVYATCSYSPEEDEAILDWLVDTNMLEPLLLRPDPTWGVVVSQGASGATGLRCFPHRLTGEGFFLAALRRKGSPDATRPARFRTEHQAAIAGAAAGWIKPGDWRYVATGKAGYSALPAAHEADWMRVREALYLRRVGLPLGEPAKNDWIPSHDLAWAVDRSDALPILNLDRQTALHYMKGTAPENASGARGWMLAAYEGLGLGWVKGLGNRFNNYLPKNVRLRRNIDE